MILVVHCQCLQQNWLEELEQQKLRETNKFDKEQWRQKTGLTTKIGIADGKKVGLTVTKLKKPIILRRYSGIQGD